MYPGAHSLGQPDKPAVIMADTGETITYHQLEQGSARFARVLHDRGVRPGDVIAVLSDNTPAIFYAYWAALRSGLYVTAINHHLTADEAAYIVTDSDAKVLVSSAALGDLAARLTQESPKLTEAFSFGGNVSGHEPLEAAISTPVEPLPSIPRGSDMLYSSGTTGRPKGIKPTPSSLQLDDPNEPGVRLMTAVGNLSASTVYLSPAPIYHAAPLRWCAAVQANGGTVVMMRSFDAEAMLAAIEEFSVTATQVVPTMFVRLLQLPAATRGKYATDSLETVVHAAAPCPPEVKEAMLAWWGPIVTEYYAATEANGVTTITSTEWLEHRGSVGRAVLGIIHICADNGEELPAGEVGTIYFERDEVPFTYHNDPEKTAQAIHPDHPTWSSIGDIGFVDADDYLYLTDRKAFTIISGGVNIYPQEIENALALHPAVYDAAVVGVPDAEMGQKVKAFIQLQAGNTTETATAEHIKAYLQDRIARFKIPREIEFVETLPRTPTGKLKKGSLV